MYKSVCDELCVAADQLPPASQHRISELILTSVAPFLMQLSANDLEKATEDGPSV